MKNEEIDLFEAYETLPQDVQKCLEKWGEKLDHDQSYDNCRGFLEEVEKLGYTFDYYLDAMPYNLRKL